MPQAIVDRPTHLRPAGKGAFVNDRGSTNMMRVPGNRSGAMVNPTYAMRNAAAADRAEYSAAGNEAAALSAAAPSTVASDFAQGQAIRDNAIGQARQQTVQHFQIRDQMAESRDRAAAQRDERIRMWAELALKGRMADSDTELKRRGLAIDEQQLVQQGEYQQGQLDLGQQEVELRGTELENRKAEGVEDRKLKQQELAADKDYKNKNLALQQKQLETNTAESQADRASREKIAEQELDARRKGARFTPAGAFTRAGKLGVDTSGFQDEEGKRTPQGQEFYEMANQIRAENPDWTQDEVLQGAAEELGLSQAAAPGGAAGAGAQGQDRGAPPVSGAQWSDKAGGWIVQQDGKWVKVVV